MTGRVFAASRGVSRLAVVVMVAATIGASALATSRLGAGAPARGPIAHPNPDSEPPTVYRVGGVGGVLHVESSEAHKGKLGALRAESQPGQGSN